MKVSLTRPSLRKMSISNLVLLDRGKGQIHFINASRVEADVPSSAYKQTYTVWVKERGN